MIAEQLINNASTTLSSSATSSTTTLSVTTGSVFPSTGNFRLVVDTEIMLCTARSSNTLTVVRGYESTTGASHASGSTISCVLTVGSVQSYLTDAVHNYSLSSRPSVGRLLDSSGATLTSSSFTTTNTAGATITDQSGTLLFTLPAQSSGVDLITLLRAAPSPTYSVTCALQLVFATGQNNCSMYAGLALSDTSGKLISHGIYCPGSTSQTFEIGSTKWTSNILPSADYTFHSTWCNSPYVWLKLTDDGTNLSFFRSHDGVNWVQDWQVSRTDWLTSGPTTVGLLGGVSGTAPSNASSATGLVTIAHYSES